MRHAHAAMPTPFPTPRAEAPAEVAAGARRAAAEPRCTASLQALLVPIVLAPPAFAALIEAGLAGTQAGALACAALAGLSLHLRHCR